MITDLHACPVASYPLIPLLGSCGAWRQGADVVTGFGGGEGVAFAGALALHDDQRAGEGEVGGGGLDRGDEQCAFFEATTGAMCKGKKGEL